MKAPIVQPGRYYEDMNIGDTYQHPHGRTLTDADNIWFSSLVQNTAAIHIDHHYSAQTEFGKPLMNSTMVLAVATGQSVNDLSRHVYAILGWDEVKLPKPFFAGDTLYAQSEILDKRESKSHTNVGIVTAKTTGYNQNGEVVIIFKRALMVYKRGCDPRPAPPQPKT